MKRNYDNTPPFAASIIESLRAFGYDLSTAIADLVDNSISAGAKNIYINFVWNGDKSIAYVIDDGCGMSLKELIEAMRFGSKSPLAKRPAKDLGRFGLGLKTASLSQCRRMTVFTKNKKGLTYIRCWDLDVISSSIKGEWKLLRDADELGNHYLSKLEDRKSGTLVLWQNLDRLTRNFRLNNEKHHDIFLDKIKKVEIHLGMVFHRLMSGSDPVKIFINDKLIKSWDPYMEDHIATLALSSDIIKIGSSKIIVQPYILPHFTKLTDAQYELGSGPKGWLAQQGFYIYRNDRLLVAGDWLDQSIAKEEHLKLGRISIDLPNTVDSEWQLDVTKSRATPPPELRPDLNRISEIIREKARSVYSYRGVNAIERKNTELNFIWNIKIKHNKTFYKINTKHPLIVKLREEISSKSVFDSLLKIIEQTIPVEHIAFVSTQKPDLLPRAFEDKSDDEIKFSMLPIFDSLLKKGLSREDSKAIIANIHPYDNFLHIVNTL